MRASEKISTISEEDQLRANLYGLLAGLLARPASGDLLASAAKLSGGESDLGRAFNDLADKARTLSERTIAEEYQDLFIGVGRGELLPYGSYYLTGFLNEKPLARLRVAMRGIGAERDPAVKEPEDHIASLMDIMAGLITGAFGAVGTIAQQRSFFLDHVDNWAPHFFKDLEAAKGADFYRPVGSIGRLFMDIERAAFEME